MKQLFATALAAVVALACATPAGAQDKNDPLYRSGARELGGPAVSEELAGLDALARAKATGKLVACADPFNYPYSVQNSEPAGFDVDIFRAVAKRAGLRAEMFWSDTGTRGGLARAFRSSIGQNKCDLFLGLSVGGDEDTMKENKLVFSHPYMGLGYVLVVQGKAESMTTLADFKKNSAKIGVAMSTPMDDYLFTHEIPRELYFQSRRVFEGMAKGEVDASMVWAAALGEAKRDYPNARFHVVQNFVPEPGLRWNSAVAVPAKETALKAFIDDSFDELVKNGEVKRIVESYGVPFYAPFPPVK